MRESQIQKQVIDWFDLAHKGLGIPDARLLYAIPNGAYFGAGFKETKRGKVPLAVIRSQVLKRQGMRSGIPDLCLAVPRVVERQFSGALYVELKRNKGGVVSDNQIDVGAILRAAGNTVWVARGFDEAVNHIVDYLAGARVPAF